MVRFWGQKGSKMGPKGERPSSKNCFFRVYGWLKFYILRQPEIVFYRILAVSTAWINDKYVCRPKMMFHPDLLHCFKGSNHHKVFQKIVALKI